MCNPDARGAFFGFTASTTRSDMARAVYEGVCFSLRHIQSVMESGGVRIGTVKLAGGLAQNPLLNAIKADITGKILVPLLDHELTTSGAAAIVGHALGWYPSEAEAACVLGQGGTPVLPDTANTAVYDRQFRLYTMLAEQLSPLFLPSETRPIAPIPPIECPIQIDWGANRKAGRQVLVYRRMRQAPNAGNNAWQDWLNSRSQIGDRASWVTAWRGRTHTPRI